MKTSDFDYELPDGRIARYPTEHRDESRLLVLSRGGTRGRAGGSSGPVRHLRFRDVPGLLSPGDLLVLNESRVLPARLLGRKPTGAPAEILLLRPFSGSSVPAAPEDPATAEDPATTRGTAGMDTAATGGTDPPARRERSRRTDPAATTGDARSTARLASADAGYVWEALVRPGGKLKPGRRVVISDELEVAILDSTPESGRVVRLETELDPREALERYGHMPLPPYLDREDEPLDRLRYQTVYARRPGSVAAPTAGLHFTEPLLGAIEEKGVEVARVTLHVGVGTFRPVEEEDPRDHSMHGEVYEVPEAAARAVDAARRRGGRVWAVGTTVVRTLESAAGDGGAVRPGPGTTDLFIAPGYDFRVVEGLITNFHLPRSTLLMLVCAFAGRERVLAAYEEAVREGYRFYSYGDAMALF